VFAKRVVKKYWKHVASTIFEREVGTISHMKHEAKNFSALNILARILAAKQKKK
jgi:hypothetical protein